MTARGARLLFTCLILDLLSRQFVLTAGGGKNNETSSCHLEFSPPKAVVMFGGSVSVNCSSSVSYGNIGWEVSDGESNNNDSSLAIWTVSKLSQWDIKPICYRMKHGQPCSEVYSFIVYKTPNSVSIRASHAGAMMEGNQYELQCDVQDVAPVQFLTVKWYKGQKVVNVTSFTDTIKTPVNQAATIVIRPDRDDDGAQYRCEAELLAEELNPPLNISSKPLNITVHFQPIINKTKLPSVVPVFRDNPVVLVCEAEGNPKPTISWSLRENVVINGENITITEKTSNPLVCTAKNSAGNITREVRVVVKEDYLPLLAGLVALTVAVISVIFVFIYSIYYKTAKMGHYSLKNVKTNAQNGNIAQSGKDNSIPMKKLSQSSILA